MHTTVQDLGRPGYRAEGVPLGGAMDRYALRVANLLVGNDEDTPALEFTLLGPELEFSHEALVAVTGGDFGGLPLGRPVLVAAGQRVSFHSAASGCRGYLAIAGGFTVPRVLGSASTYVRGGFGGLEGRVLATGDVLQAPEVKRRVAGHWRVDPRLVPDYHEAPVVRVVRGAEGDDYGPAFYDEPYQVLAHSDRMGFRLKGPALSRRTDAEIRSRPVAPGTVQVPPDGQPIVLMADAQTLGGYPQVAHVITVDLPLVAQRRPGDTLTFRAVALEDARELALAREQALAMLRHGLALKLG
ncbi:biotin-dependent carboxyltransferase family protein [Opitutus sp. ER46]|uniref:5-oxoprolinase subunit C family protein n=1 Tax=Opitutus sp. ER46 TaxID=2161864 RepID=UPI001E3B1638|nr:biotin-dependent carboxyltransferase family protein [Opitutus sp. ER46]